jgi:RHH-type rel operon transcriptional repressor/antitoxin RelB
MPTSIRLTQSVEARLDNLAQKTGRTKAFYLRELVERGLQDLEDDYLANEAVKRVQQPLQFPIENVPNEATAKSLLLSDEEKDYKRFDITQNSK